MGRKRRTYSEIYDFVIIVTLFGNDFLPPVVSLLDMRNVDRILEIYADLGRNLTFFEEKRPGYFCGIWDFQNS